MSCAVLQKGLEPPTLDQLKQAFRGIPGLTPADASRVSRHAFGVLARSLTPEAALLLKNALAAQGFESEVADEAMLPALPMARHVNRMDCTPQALMISDPLGRSFPLEWKNILLISAGRVSVEEFDRVRVDSLLPSYDSEAGALRKKGVEYRSKEQRHDRHLLEITVSRAVLRYCVNADESAHLLFQCLGPRRTRDLAADFTLLVGDLIKGAPDAALNRGANSVRVNAAGILSYPGKNAFYEETVWLLWQMTRGSRPAA